MATRHWGTDCNVLNDPVGELGRTQLYIGLPSTCGSMDSDQMFFVGGLLIRDPDRYKCMNKPLALKMKLLSP